MVAVIRNNSCDFDTVFYGKVCGGGGVCGMGVGVWGGICFPKQQQDTSTSVAVSFYVFVFSSSICLLSFDISECKDWVRFVCVEVLRPSQPNGVMSSAVSLPNHTFTGQA